MVIWSGSMTITCYFCQEYLEKVWKREETFALASSYIRPFLERILSQSFLSVRQYVMVYSVAIWLVSTWENTLTYFLIPRKRLFRKPIHCTFHDITDSYISVTYNDHQVTYTTKAGSSLWKTFQLVSIMMTSSNLSLPKPLRKKSNNWGWRLLIVRSYSEWIG